MAQARFTVPPALATEWWREREWLAALPRIAAECAQQWGLELEDPIDTPHSLVVPARDVVLKVNAPSHFEADHEADALAHWRGEGAVRLLARDDSWRAFVIERCRPGTRLWDVPDAHGKDVVSELLPRLWIKPEEPHRFRLVVDEAERWATEVRTRYNAAGRPFERSLLDLALQVYEDPGGSAMSLANQDLHGGNILRAARKPWLVIDPKPIVGDREVNGVGLLRNAAFSGGTPQVREWLDVLADLGLDRERLQSWGAAHALAWGWTVESGWSAPMVAAARAIADA
jgi:streptomycin 6-kinase